MYSGRKVTPSFSYVTEGGEEKMERTKGSKRAKCLSMYTATENIFPLLISTQSMAF
jgi:hypothetical protein